MNGPQRTPVQMVLTVRLRRLGDSFPHAVKGIAINRRIQRSRTVPIRVILELGTNTFRINYCVRV